MTTADQIYASLMEESTIINAFVKTIPEKPEGEAAVNYNAELVGKEQTLAFRQFAMESMPSLLNDCAKNGDSPQMTVTIAIYHGLMIGYRYGRNTTLSSDLPLRPE